MAGSLTGRSTGAQPCVSVVALNPALPAAWEVDAVLTPRPPTDSGRRVGSYLLGVTGSVFLELN